MKLKVLLTITKLSYVAGTNWGLMIYKDLRWKIGLSLGYRNTKYQFMQNIEGDT